MQLYYVAGGMKNIDLSKFCYSLLLSVSWLKML